MTTLKPFQSTAEQLSENHPDLYADANRQIQTRVRLRIPKQYHQEPVISNLITQHGLTVNIAAALLGANARDDGWFDLDLSGRAAQIRGALLYLNDLDLEIWYGSDQEDGGW